MPNIVKYTPHIKAAEVLCAYTLLITFTDGSIKTYDCSEIVKETFRHQGLTDAEVVQGDFRDPKIFAKFFVKNGAIYWKVGKKELAYDPCEFYYFGKDYVK